MTPPTQPPTADELLDNPVVLREMELAWHDSLADDAASRHEEGGWIYMDVVTGAISIRRTRAGSRRQIVFANPPLVPTSVVVGTFHTHPNPTADGWDSEPSETDRTNSVLTGVPWLIRAEDGYHKCGPDQRRNGLSGGPGFPQ